MRLIEDAIQANFYEDSNSTILKNTAERAYSPTEPETIELIWQRAYLDLSVEIPLYQRRPKKCNAWDDQLLVIRACSFPPFETGSINPP